jgi:hypothetical protein
MNLSAAFAALTAADITPDVLAAEGIDPADPQALRALVDEQLRSILAENRIVSHAQVASLQAAWYALRTPAELAADDELAQRLAASMAAFLAPAVQLGDDRWCAADVYEPAHAA